MVAETKPPVEKMFNLGEPKISKSGNVHFPNSREHPDVRAAYDKYAAAQDDLHTKLKGNEAFAKEEAELMKAFEERHGKKFAEGMLAATNNDPAAANKILAPINAEKQALQDALYKKHAAEQFKPFDTARKELNTAKHELRSLELAKLKGMDVTKIEGYTAEHADAVAKSIATRELGVKAAGKFGILRTEGIGNAISHNVGGEAWRTSKGRAFAHVASTALGGTLMGDAIFRSETKDKEGNVQKRSVVGRWTEGLVGGVITGASLLHGGRS